MSNKTKVKNMLMGNTDFMYRKTVLDTMRERGTEVRIEWYKKVSNEYDLVFDRGIAFTVKGGKVFKGALVKMKEFDPVSVKEWVEYDEIADTVVGWSCREDEKFKVFSVGVPKNQ